MLSKVQQTSPPSKNASLRDTMRIAAQPFQVEGFVVVRGGDGIIACAPECVGAHSFPTRSTSDTAIRSCLMFSDVSAIQEYCDQSPVEETTSMCDGQFYSRLYAVMESSISPIFVGTLEECDEFMRLSGIVPLEDTVVEWEELPKCLTELSQGSFPEQLTMNLQ
jgi:hypothetical protein